MGKEMIIFLWAIIMIMMATFRIFQIYLGLPEFDEYFNLVMKFAWIVSGVHGMMIALAYIFHRRKFAWMRK
jgi:hypothetical protein